MRKWPEKHKILLIISLLLAAAALLFSFLVLKPVWAEHSMAVTEMDELNRKLGQSEWPRDPDRLNAILNEYRKHLEKDNGSGAGQRDDTRKVLESASSMFQEMITREYGTKQDFINKASQTEYKDQFDKLDTYLQGKGISLDTTVFGMNELSSEEENYPMLLKLWTAKAVVDCILESGMKIANARTQGGRMRPSPQLKVLKAKSYFIDDKSAKPYLIEYPIYAEITGNIGQLAKLADLLYVNGRFLPLTQLEIVANLPPWRQPRPTKGDMMEINSITARIVCSSFFMPDSSPESAPVINNGTTTPKPPGI